RREPSEHNLAVSWKRNQARWRGDNSQRARIQVVESGRGKRTRAVGSGKNSSNVVIRSEGDLSPIWQFGPKVAIAAATGIYRTATGASQSQEHRKSNTFE